ncbi:MAG: 4Fe-4S cluster-binding domain-containing protein [Elusimicrobiaceae bacterium]|jgi:organic radical activating enzyme|nr:4Fe-4S cluster-binding domain-containing protein [Elusimicrobiaceae bacterium]MBT3954946.1 4Fe-4S cluster-binding domain-containing protein [Elusimicrobiaceae bacterium]MBT4008596.1 4Fe-4S cluster-binding domain-containing protein [Elusimicrobiaceae bacterium]MBT4402966.1 4Fe-4S cluster-binding domain-containing protein [Elusimicrobiaceae bacterium]MBT4439762.1 4Fe-4S cluster-binding domain-containing protein [Elusimicrobiaceae bacterium]
MKLIKQGDENLFKNTRVLVIHLEFTSVCNQTCSYCLEDNGNPDKIEEKFSDPNKMLSAIDKIFEITKPSDFIGFIIAGGEPTLQPSFKEVVSKILSRKNTSILLTTNLSQSVEYYETLNVPMVTSLHLESHNPKDYLEKTKKLHHLIAHTRIMAHPQKMDIVEQTYKDFLEASKQTPLSFAVEKIFGFGSYNPNYAEKDLEKFKNMPPVDCEYPQNLKDKLGLLENAFYRSLWYYYDNTIKKDGSINFKDFYCERNLLVVQGDGTVKMCWCYDPKVNIFNTQKLPNDIFSTIICKEETCPMGFAGLMAKFADKKFAPKYIKTKNLPKHSFRERIKKLLHI